VQARNRFGRSEPGVKAFLAGDHLAPVAAVVVTVPAQGDAIIDLGPPSVTPAHDMVEDGLRADRVTSPHSRIEMVPAVRTAEGLAGEHRSLLPLREGTAGIPPWATH
jgi:hypothetical protein